MKNTFKYFTAAILLAFGAVASATVILPPPPMVIDFGTGLGASGQITYDQNGVDVTGTDIFIGAMNVFNAPNGLNGAYTVGGLLNFSTADNTIVITGTVNALGINDSNTELLTGSFNDGGWSFGSAGVPGLNVFTGIGEDTKSEALLAALGAPVNQQFDFFGFSLDSDYAGGVVSTDITNTASAGREFPPNPVPLPATVWLLGSGLIGMVGFARRKKVA